MKVSETAFDTVNLHDFIILSLALHGDRSSLSIGFLHLWLLSTADGVY